MPSFERILVATDFSDTAAQALRYALHFARHDHAEVHIAHVEEKEADGRGRRDASLREQVNEWMADVIASANVADVRTSPVVLHGEEIAPALTEYADEIAADLIVIGTHGRRGLRRLVMGSVAEKIVRKAKRPVLAVREREGVPPEPRMQHLLLPLDFSESSLRAIPYAKDLAARYQARLTAIHVFDDVDLPGFYGDFPNPLPIAAPEIENKVRGTLREAVEAAPGPDVPVEFAVGRGAAPNVIVDEAENREIDLVVMASHGQSGVERLLLGSVSEHVLRAAPCPVLLVRVGRDEGKG
ncbi:MAG: universal stress protein [Rhodothermales bacterium]